MYTELKTLPVEKSIECQNCGHELKMGDTVYKDEYRNETICAYCIGTYMVTRFITGDIEINNN